MPKPRNFTCLGFFNPMLSVSESLNKIVLSLPVSNIKDSFTPFTFKGITIKLLIN